MAVKAGQSPDKKASRELRVTWGDSSALEFVFADQLHVIEARGNFYVSLGQTRLAIGPMDTVKGEVRPVGNYVVTRDALQRIYEAIGRTLEGQPS